MRAAPLLLAIALGLAGCAPRLLVQSRPQDAERAWQPAFAGVYFETRPSPLFTWMIARAVRAGDPFIGNQLRTHAEARDAFLRAAGSGGVTRQLLEELWKYTAADSIAVWQVWCDDGAMEESSESFDLATKATQKEVTTRTSEQLYYLTVAHADGTSDRYPVEPSKFGHCNMTRDRFTVHVSLYDRENPLPVARLVASGVVGLNEALQMALAEAPKAFRVSAWSAWNWSTFAASAPAAAH